MPNEIYLDGQKFTHHTEGLEEMSLTYELKKNIVGYGITDTVEVMKDAYDYLYSVFFADACAGKDAKVDVTVIINSCCLEPQTFTFVLKHQSVKLRALECIIEVELEAENPCQKNYEYLRDTVFWDDGFDQETQYALRYCTQNDNFLLFMWLFQMFFVLLLTMQIIETVISGILNFIITVLFWIGVINKDLKEQLFATNDL